MRSQRHPRPPPANSYTHTAAVLTGLPPDLEQATIRARAGHVLKPLPPACRPPTSRSSSTGSGLTDPVSCPAWYAWHDGSTGHLVLPGRVFSSVKEVVTRRDLIIRTPPTDDRARQLPAHVSVVAPATLAARSPPATSTDAATRVLAPCRPRLARDLLGVSAECTEPPTGFAPVTYALRGRRETPHNALTSTDRTPEHSQRTRRPGRTPPRIPRWIPRGHDPHAPGCWSRCGAARDQRAPAGGPPTEWTGRGSRGVPDPSPRPSGTQARPVGPGAGLPPRPVFAHPCVDIRVRAVAEIDPAPRPGSHRWGRRARLQYMASRRRGSIKHRWIHSDHVDDPGAREVSQGTLMVGEFLAQRYPRSPCAHGAN